VPSFAIPLWLILAAAAGSDPSSPPPRGRAATAPLEPVAPTVKSPTAPPNVKGPKPPTAPTAPTAKAASAGKTPATSQETPSAVEEPEEEIPADSKSRGHRKPARKTTTADYPEVPERKTTWSIDRYAAVVPPGLTLAALRSQLAKAQVVPAEANAPMADGPSASLADIERAREALRQETARLEALLKATGNCGGGSMPIGDGLATPTVVSPTALREAPTEQIDSVSKAMKGMKPEQAAAMVARLDRGLAAEIMRRMKPADAGAVLGLLKPEMAAELATQIATRKSIYGKDKKGPAK